MNERNANVSGPVPKIIFACSGAADVGALSDQAARELLRIGAGRMFCLAGVGGRVPEILATTRSAAKILVIDGCRQNCAQKTLEDAGFTSYAHLKLEELGLKKGKTPVTTRNIEKVAAQGIVLLG
jgi:uncharacterized metal-binding protein